jgi:acyl transferase domain-containing protein
MIEQKTSRLSEPPRLVFVYGAREMLWPGIYPYLISGTESIRETLARCESLILARLGWSLKEALAIAGRHLPQEKVDPALCAVQIALTRGWRERGIQPDVIAARSGGEHAAEYAGGVLELEEALEVPCRWSQLQHKRRGEGTLLLAGASPRRMAELARASPAPFFIATDTDDRRTLIACAAGAIARVRVFLTAQGVALDATGFTCAPHSPLIDAWKSAYVDPPLKTRAQASSVPYYSAGAQAPDRGTSHYERLWQSARVPVRMGRTLRRVIADGGNVFVEVGGVPRVRERIERLAAAAGRKVAVLPTMLARQPVGPVMDETHARLLELGVPTRPA